jgi:hypothetical protein
MSKAKKYPYDRINRLNDQLESHGVAPGIIADIMSDAEKVVPAMKPEGKADWLRNAMVKIDSHLDLDTRRKIREGCACCLGGKRLDLSKKIFKNGKTLEERIKLANETPFVFGHSVSQREDSKVVVRFGPEGPATFKCPCLPKAEQPLSKTYCMCCGGHVKHHLQIALGKKVECEVVSSILSTGGKETCVFHFDLLD